VLDAFTAETGIGVSLAPFESNAEAVARVRQGDTADVVVVENQSLPELIEEGRLAALNHANLPNFRNISPNFRNLLFDPRNLYSVPYSWGATGIVVAHDERLGETMRWADLWDSRYCGRIAVWREQVRDMIAAALKSLGYSANSEDPAQLAAAGRLLEELRPCVVLLDHGDPVRYAQAIARGELVIAAANPYEALELQQAGFAVDYVVPVEGPLLWGDAFVVPAASLQRQEAEQLINFLLRPEISATLANANFFRTANAAAEPLLSAELTTNPTLFPPVALLANAEMVLPPSPAGQTRYAALESAFLGE
jgi:spermidine/putrescine transport system substrate-binding protein